MKDLDYIELKAIELNVGWLFQDLLMNYPQFEDWSGSHRPDYHHYGPGGLIKHTREVIELGFATMPILNLQHKVKPVEYFCAALFHDTGKLFDYDEHFNEVSHKRLIYHIPRSILIWHDAVRGFPQFAYEHENNVLHAILAHHGQRQFGSPVAPKTHLAWLLHLCDGISARMDDADKIDVVKKKE
jgi:3'-5' exoribonuclease